MLLLILRALIFVHVVAYCAETEETVSVEEGRPATLKCRFDPRLVRPENVIYWSQSSINGWDNVAIGPVTFRSNYRVHFNRTAGGYDLNIDSVVYERDNGKFACKIRSGGNNNDLHDHSLSLVVLKQPGAPVISSPQLPLTEAAPAKLTCSSTGGSPPPQIRWYRLDEAGSGTVLDSRVSESIDRRRPTVSTLLLTPTRRDDSASIQCAVWNRAMSPGQRLTETIRLHVNYSPRLQVLPADYISAEEGSSVEVRCDVDAKPAVPNVRWMRNGNFVSTSRVYRLDSLQLSDAGSYTCSAQNEVGETKQQLQLDVLHAPRVSIEPLQTEVSAGASVQVECSVDANPRADQVYWIKRGSKFRQSGRVLSLTAVTAADDGHYLCIASNTITSGRDNSMRSHTRSSNATTRLSVRHKPGGASVVLHGQVAVEGRSMTLSCAVEPAGHPAPTFRWWRQDQPAKVLAYTQNLTVALVTQQHTGVYMCQGENELGRGQVAMRRLQIYRAPEFVVRLQPHVVRNANTRAFRVTCSAMGRPRLAVHWYKDGMPLELPRGDYQMIVDESQSDNKLSQLRSTLSFTGAARNNATLGAADAGNYTCRFSNVAGIVESTMKLQVEHAPVFRQRHSRVAFDTGDSATLTCTVKAFPQPRFSWIHRGKTVGGTGDTFYSTARSQLADDLHQSTLSLRDVRQRDYGQYTCQARNSEGQVNVELVLQPKSRPDPAEQLHVVNISSSWVLVQWTPGFNGGHTGTVYQASLTSQHDHQRTIDCHEQQLCNITQLQHQTTYRLRVLSRNSGGLSAPSGQIQFATTADVSQLRGPYRASFEHATNTLVLHAPNIPAGVFAAVETKSEGGAWKPAGDLVKIDNQRASINVTSTLSITQVRVKMCLPETTIVCGASVLAETGTSGSALSSVGGDGVSVTTIVVSVVPVIVGVTILALLSICRCSRKHHSNKKTRTFDRQAISGYYPAGCEKTVNCNGTADKQPTIDGNAVGECGVASMSTTAVYNQHNGYCTSASNQAACSVNSQDSLWHVQPAGATAAVSDTLGVSANMQHYDPTTHANYLPDSVAVPAVYDDYGYCTSGAVQCAALPPHALPASHLHLQPYAVEQQQQQYVPPGTVPQYSYAVAPGACVDDNGRAGISADHRRILSFDESLESGLSTPTAKHRRVIREVVV